uniref:Uncharacterized protein n=1 Tax=Glossina austeni TaxID=7395 RepID=A0A1A9UP42_GLOAU
MLCYVLITLQNYYYAFNRRQHRLSILIQSFTLNPSVTRSYTAPHLLIINDRMQYREFPITIDNLYSLRYSSNGNISKMHHQNMKRTEAEIWTCWLQNCTYFTAIAQCVQMEQSKIKAECI